MPVWYDSDYDKVLREKEKWRDKANSASGTEADHEKFRKFRSDFKKIMDQKMRLHVEDDSDPALISKKFWKHEISPNPNQLEFLEQYGMVNSSEVIPEIKLICLMNFSMTNLQIKVLYCIVIHIL